MLKVFDLTKKYHKVIAVDNVNFTVEKGSVTVLLGPMAQVNRPLLKVLQVYYAIKVQSWSMA